MIGMPRTDRNHIDMVIFIAVIILMFMSLGIVYSASASWAQAKYGESERMLISHAIKVFLGLIALFIGIRINYQKLERFTKLALIAAVCLLAATLVMGGEAKGASRWLRYGSLGIQPSEFAKYALLFHLSALIAVKGELLRNFKHGFIPAIIWIGLVTGLVMLQPNFSMGTMIFGLGLLMLFVGRAKFSHVLLLFAIVVPLLALYMWSAPYRRVRMMDFLHLQHGASGTHNYQLQQGIFGFANGGIFGVGPGESKQRDLFLPESYGDFVFSIVGEEYGFLGTMFVMVLFLVIMIRGLEVARHASDMFGRNLAIAITCAITLYALVNAGVTLGMLPTTGLPMPFVSYGGSSMVFSAFAVGVLLNISSQTDLHPRASELPVVGEIDVDDMSVGKVY